jgi:hypothetical protein
MSIAKVQEFRSLEKNLVEALRRLELPAAGERIAEMARISSADIGAGVQPRCRRKRFKATNSTNPQISVLPSASIGWVNSLRTRVRMGGLLSGRGSPRIRRQPACRGGLTGVLS